MQSFFEKPFVQFLRIAIAAAIVSFILFAFTDGDAFRAIWAGCFVVLLYYTHDAIDEMVSKGRIKEDAIFFTNKFACILTFSIFLLFSTTIAASLIHGLLVDKKYCNEESFFHSEKQCALQKVEERFYEESDYNEY